MERLVEVDVKIKVRVPNDAKSSVIHKLVSNLSEIDGDYTYSVDVTGVDNPIENRAFEVRERFRRGGIDKIPAIKLIREIFLNSGDERGSLKGAKDYIEGVI